MRHSGSHARSHALLVCFERAEHGGARKHLANPHNNRTSTTRVQPLAQELRLVTLVLRRARRNRVHACANHNSVSRDTSLQLTPQYIMYTHMTQHSSGTRAHLARARLRLGSPSHTSSHSMGTPLAADPTGTSQSCGTAAALPPPSGHRTPARMSPQCCSINVGAPHQCNNAKHATHPVTKSRRGRAPQTTQQMAPGPAAPPPPSVAPPPPPPPTPPPAHAPHALSYLQPQW